MISSLLLLGIAQNIALAFALVRARSTNALANRILTGILIVFSFSLADGFLFETNYFLKYPHLIAVEWPTAFLYGPLAFLYVRTLTSAEGFALKWNHLVHLAPFGMHALLLTPFYLLTGEEKARVIELLLSQMKKEPGFNLDPMLLVLVIQMAVYLVVSLRLIMAYSEKLKQHFSSVEKINLTWLRDLFIALFCLWCVFSIVSGFAPRFGVYKESIFFVRLMEAVVILVMGFKGLRQSRVFVRIEALQTAENSKTATEGPLAVPAFADEARIVTDSAEKDKYRKSSLTDGEAMKIIRQLTVMMEQDKPFLEPELTLPELSGRLSVSPNHLSQVINGELKRTFFDFVNEYRVGEARRLLTAPEYGHLSILGIAMEAGFNSKNAFYSAFKKYTGMTPSQFKEHRKNAGHPKEPVSPGLN